MHDHLTFTKWASEWIEGTPVGNGRIGFMQYGEAGNDVFAFNHDALFRQKNRKTVKTAHLIDEIRSLLGRGECKKAEALFLRETENLPEHCDPYQPFHDLRITFDGAEGAKDYHKTLDLSRGVLSIGYALSSHTVKYEAFASAVHGVIAIKVQCDRRASCRLLIEREADAECAFSTAHTDHGMYTEGRFFEGVCFASALQCKTNGNVEKIDGGIAVNDFTEMLLWLSLDVSDHALDHCLSLLSALPDYETVKDAHTKDFSSLYERVALTLETEAVDSEKAYEMAMEGKITPDIYAYLFNMARYCIISCSRMGSNPINLQGLWCHDLEPNWDCGYTTDINIEMAYWATEILGLAECELPLFDWLRRNRETMESQAESIFGAKRAVYVPQYTDLLMTPTCWKEYAPFQVLWSGAATWLAQHYYTYWKHTRDDAMMRDEGYPFMAACARFYLQMLTKEEDGRYTLSPSASPENWTKEGGLIVEGATMDLTLPRELFTNLLSVCDALGIEDRDADQWRYMLGHLKAFAYGEDGALLEFTDGNEVINPHHRHLSHVYALFPGTLAASDERLKAGCEKAIDNRLEYGPYNATSWAMAWYACLFASLGKGDRSLEFVRHIVKGGLMENYLTTHNDWRQGSSYCYGDKIFQIDSLLGIARALANMFIICDKEKTRVLPALPSHFPSGSIRGLRGWGVFTYDLSWNDGKLASLSVHAEKGGDLSLQLPLEIDTCTHPYTRCGTCYTFTDLRPGDTLNITAKA